MNLRFGDDFFVYLVDDTPTSISEAYASLEADYWKDAVLEICPRGNNKLIIIIFPYS